MTRKLQQTVLIFCFVEVTFVTDNKVGAFDLLSKRVVFEIPVVFEHSRINQCYYGVKPVCLVVVSRGEGPDNFPKMAEACWLN